MVCAMVCACMCDGMCMCVVCAWRAWYMHASPLQGWSWHDCHQHWHYDNYAHYALRKLCTNEDVAWEDRPVVGHKNGWCAAIIYHSMVRHAVHSPIPYCDAFIGV